MSDAPAPPKSDQWFWDLPVGCEGLEIREKDRAVFIDETGAGWVQQYNADGTAYRTRIE
jgi:hypothetical protein